MDPSFTPTGPEREGFPRARVLRALTRAGSLGITSKQLALVTQLPGETVTRQLATLRAQSAVLQLGRGLWVLEQHRTLPTEEPTTYVRTFEEDFDLTIGQYQGRIQFRGNEQLPVHRWWPYVQGFSAEFVEDICRRYAIGKGRRVLDPFCGSGTVPTVARLLGATAYGSDLMPIAAFVSAAKQEWGADPAMLLRLGERVSRNRTPPTLSPPFLRETPRHYSARVRDSLLRLRQNIEAVPDSPEQRLLRLAFASLLIDTSRLHRSPCLGYAARKSVDADAPYRLLDERLGRIAEDLTALRADRDRWGPPAQILNTDSATAAWPEGKVDLAVTSPPYVNGMDYVMNYKIDLAWMGFARSYADLQELKTRMVACDNIPRATTSGHTPSRVIREDPWIQGIAQAIEQRIRMKGSYRRTDMGAVVQKYFDDLLPVLRNVFRTLAPGGRLVVVNGDSLIAGTYVPGDLIFARIATRVGFRVDAFEVARARRSGQRRNFLLRESVLTLQRPGA